MGSKAPKFSRIGTLILFLLILSALFPSSKLSFAAAPPTQEPRIPWSTDVSANFIVINSGGFVPASMTIEVGESVTWHNATNTTHTLQSGRPSPITDLYLPLIFKNAGGNQKNTIKDGPISLPTDPTLTGVEDFTVSLSPGEGFTYTFTLTGTHDFHLATATQFTGRIIVIEKQPTTVERASPANGENKVAVTRETIIEFNHPLAEGDIPAGAIAAQFGGQTLPARLHLSPDRRRITLFYDDPLPASARVRVTIDGDRLSDGDGNAVDADDDGLSGGIGLIDFDTLSLSRVPNTDVWGYVYDSYDKNPDGSDRPVVGATIRVDGFPDANAVTDANGYFLLEDMPAPVFFVHVDGSTAGNAPPGTQYATVGKAFHSVPGQSTQLMMDGEIFNIYLPPMDLGDLQTLSSTEETEVAFGAAGKAELVEMFPTVDPTVWDQTMVMFPPNSAVDDLGSPATEAAIIPVPSDRLPAPLSPGLNHQLDIAVIAPGASNFDEPASACFPNLPDPDTGQPLPPGSKSALTSFNHDTGQWEIVGPMTVSADGKLVCTDPGVGIRAPGWHGVQQSVSAKGGDILEGWEPSPGSNYFERLACLVVRPLYCQAKFGTPCKATCNEVYSKKGLDCALTCTQLCDVYLAQCLASTECPFNPPRITENPTQLANSSVSLNSHITSREISLPNPQLLTGVHFFGVEELESETIIQRGVTGINGIAHTNDLFLAPNTKYRHHVIQAATMMVGYSDFTTNQSGTRLELPSIIIGIPTSEDQDGDGLHDYGEFIIGTILDNPDSDGDGIPDGAEVQQGTDPLDGLPAATGIIASADTPGTAVDVCAVNDLAAVADSAGGVSVFDISDSFSPVIIAQVETPGSAQAVACAGNRVAVADGGGRLVIIDLSDPPAAQIVHQLDLDGFVRGLASAGNTVYAGLSTGQIVLVDLASGTVLNQAFLSMGGVVKDVAVAGDYLYILANERLYALSPDLNVLGSAPSPISFSLNRRLFVGGGIAYAVHAEGYNTFSLADPAQPNLIAAGTTLQRGWRHIAANGSGLGVAAVALAPGGAGDVNLYDVSDPTQTNAFLTTFETPGSAQAVAIYNGLAYLADGEAGLQVINYLAYDALGVPPAISLETNFAPGVAEEGQRMRVTAIVSDDVQVRNVEFYLDGTQVETDGNFPFEFRFVTPLLNQQSNFTLQAKATDTGGNTTWTEVRTFTLAPDAIPPQVVQRSPLADNIVASGSVSAVSAIFSEPLDPATLTASAFQLFAAGPDGQTGTGDDVPIAGTLTYLQEANIALLAVGSPLSVDLYRAVLSPSIADLAGNSLASEVAWTFQIKDPVFWNVDADGFWDVGSNWSTGAPPQADDVVIIDHPAGDFTITVRQGAQAAHSLSSNEAIAITGGTLTLGGASSISNTLTLSGGTLTSNAVLRILDLFTWTGGVSNGSGEIIAAGDLEISGTANKTLNNSILNNIGSATWRGGRLAGSGVLLNNGTLVIEGDPVKTLSLSTINNNGTVVLTGTVGINGGGTTFNNLPGGLFDFQSDAAFNWSFSPRHIFNNFGTVRKSAGTGTSGLGVAFNGGTIEVLTGTLSLGAPGTTLSGGAFTVASGAVLDLTGNSAQTYVGAYTGSGDGTIRLASNTLNTLTIGIEGATFNFADEMFQWTGGSLSGGGTLTNIGTMVLDGVAAKTLNVSTLNNAGTVILKGETGINGGGTTFNNLPGGLFDIQSDADFNWSFSPRHIITNNGIFRKSGGSGTSAIGVDFSGGNVEVLTGTLSLSVNSTTSGGGNFTVASGASLDLTGGTSHTYVGDYTSSGGGTIGLSGGNLQIGAAGATFNFAGEMFQWTDGDLSGSGTLTNTGTLIVDGDSVGKDLTVAVNNAGTVILRGTSGLRSGNGVVFNNLAGGLFDMQSDAPFQWAFGQFPVFNNAGTLLKSTSVATASLGAIFTNSGTVDVQLGTLSLDRDGTSSGLMNIAGGQTLDINSTFENETNGIIQGTGTLDISDATFTNNGTITPSVIVIN